MNDKPRLNAPPMLHAFAAGFIAVLMTLVAFQLWQSSYEDPAQTEGLFVNSLLAYFLVILITAFWIAFRGSERKFYSHMPVRAFLVGMFTPGLMFIVAYGLEAINYGVPTQSSPYLEIRLLTSMIAGETLIQTTSYSAPEMLRTNHSNS